MNNSKNSISRREMCSLIGLGIVGLTLPLGCISSAKNFSLENLHFKNLYEVADLIKNKTISAAELTQLMLDRIERIDKKLHSYAAVMREYSLKRAKMADEQLAKGNYLGPLHGVPIAVKDLVFTKNAITTGGLSFYKDFVPEYNATVLEKLENAGAIILGKLNLTEGAMAGYHKDFEIPINPWEEEHWAGASSSGSGVATAAGLCFGSLGTDTGGSIRFPSMANGVVGLKPTFGRVSKYGVLPLSDSLDHVGPMTRCVKDAAIMFDVISGYDENDPNSINRPASNVSAELANGIKGLRIGLDESYIADNVDEEVVASILNAINKYEELGAEIVRFKIPWDKNALGGIWFNICTTEAKIAHKINYPSKEDFYGPYFRDFLAYGTSVSQEDYEDAKLAKETFKDEFLRLFNNVDVIVAPAGTLPEGITPEIQRGGMEAFNPYVATANMHFTIPANLSGTPALTFQCGKSNEGYPHSLQLMGAPFSESILCRLGYEYEQATEWHKRHPAI
jgi:amidase